MIFLSRTGSLLPFLSECQEDMATAFSVSGPGELQVSALAEALRTFHSCTEDPGTFLHVPFTTVFEYLQVRLCLLWVLACRQRGKGSGRAVHGAARHGVHRV